MILTSPQSLQLLEGGLGRGMLTCRVSARRLGKQAGSRHRGQALGLHTRSCLLEVPDNAAHSLPSEEPQCWAEEQKEKKMRLELKINWYSLNGTLDLLRPSPLQGIAKVLIKGEMMNIQDVF